MIMPEWMLRDKLRKIALKGWRTRRKNMKKGKKK